VGELPSQWNHTVDYDAQQDDKKLVHFTQGVPIHPEVAGCEYESKWTDAMNEVVSSWPSQNLKAASIHVDTKDDGTVVPKLRAVMDSQPAAEAPAQPSAATRTEASERYQSLITLYKNMHTGGDKLQGIPAESTFDGRRLVSHLQTIGDLTQKLGAKSLLDYGCGKALSYHNEITLADDTVVNDVRKL
jgi:hypothetical protein